MKSNENGLVKVDNQVLKRTENIVSITNKIIIESNIDDWWEILSKKWKIYFTYYIREYKSWQSIGSKKNIIEHRISESNYKDSDVKKIIEYEVIKEPTESDFEIIFSIEKLNIFAWDFEDITPLQKLKKLQYLKLPFNALSNIKALEDLANLKELTIFLLGECDVRPFKKLQTLKSLSITSYGIPTHIDVISKLINLTDLRISIDNLKELDFISNLINLRTFWLQGKNIRLHNTNIFLNLKKIDNLMLANSNYTQKQIEGIIKNFLNLKTLELRSINLKNIDFLKSFLSLTILKLGSNQIKNISSLINLKELKELGLYYNPIEKSKIEELRKELPNCKIGF